eukprot:scaffold117005_cov57-Phaeocystis_antarctica.AAC.2
MRSSSRSLTVPDPSASAIWKSECTHFLNPSDQAGPWNEEHGVDGLGGGGGDGGALGGQSRHTCRSGRQCFSHTKKSLKRMPGTSV